MNEKAFFKLARMHPSQPAIGGLIGLLVGDALGVPYEFHAPEQIPAPAQIEMQPPPGFRRRRHSSSPSSQGHGAGSKLGAVR